MTNLYKILIKLQHTAYTPIRYS